ncbi:MAG: hypothetical protein RRA92_08090 [Gemmatimonadota bacterium]|nr:hypothetical protein [Gemmatimonadota bacterium]
MPILAAYLGGGLAMGIVLGLLRPISGSWFGISLIGFIACFVMMAAIGFAVAGFSFSTRDWGFISVFSLLAGPLTAIRVRNEVEKMKEEGSWFELFE